MKKTITALTFCSLILTSFNSLSHSSAPNSVKKKKSTYEVGQEALGGVIFYLNKSKTHGLVAAKQDQMDNHNYQDCFDAINNPEHHDTDGQEYTDWRLPKLWEAYKMYMNLHVVNMGNFSESGYWTSKETVGFEKIHVINFAKGIDFTSLKSDTYRARAIRSF